MIPTPPGPPRRRVATGVRLALLLLLVALVGPMAAASHAAADEPVTAVLTSVAVTGTGPDAGVSLGATVTNAGAVPLLDVTVHLWRSTAVLRSPVALERALADEATPLGTWQPLAPENSAVVGEGPLAPGDSRSVTVSGRLADLGLTAGDASYWVGVTVLARAVSGEEPAEVARDRTLVTVADADAAPLLASVVELSAPPRQVKRDLFADESLAGELTGRLRVLLDAVGAGRDWVADPALVAEVADMADGYRVRTDTGSVAGTGQAAASAWLDDYRALPAGRGRVGLFARVDPLDDGTVAAADASAPPSALPGIALLDAPSPGTLAALAGRGMPVLATGVVAPGGPLLVDGTTVLAAVLPGEARLSAAMSRTALNRSAVLAALARASGGQVRLLRTADDVAADRTPGWLARGTLTLALGRDPLQVDALATTGTPRTPDPLRQSEARGVASGVAAYAEAAPSAGLETLPDAVVARAASGWWAADADGRRRLLAAVDGRAGWTALDQGLELTAIPRFSLAGASGDYPVTVTNHLIDPVTIRLVAVSDNPQRIRFAPQEPVTIAPGSSQALLLRAEAAGGGVVNAAVHVETAGGRRLTPDESIIVETTNVGFIGWALVFSSGLVLVVTTALRIRQVRAEQKAGVHG